MVSVTEMCFVSVLNEVLVPEYEIGAQFRSLEQSGSVRSLITIKIMTDDNAFIMPKSRRETGCGIEYY